MAERLHAVEARVAAAIERRGPGPDVRLIGVSKRQPLAKLIAAHTAGLRDFGENYAQELRDKQHDWPGLLPASWHYIGAIQSNKLKYLVAKTAMIHTVDRRELISAIDRRAHEAGCVQDILFEVAIAGEAQKAGAPIDALPELLEACAWTEHGAVRCRGLMIIPPAGDAEQTRQWFRALRELRDRLRDELCPRLPRERVSLGELSMGMSADFEVAIEEGATMIRVGTAIFGSR
ncbi:YggS family pyridoxal phosphate-dependent enzyme [Pseudenhygromyxa sp. WMMC2535]|nr:YggS family pyridoxal phosphate-dependent enzyme [Pseudenhygromyxa sp. WMMC2535]